MENKMIEIVTLESGRLQILVNPDKKKLLEICWSDDFGGVIDIRNFDLTEHKRQFRNSALNIELLNDIAINELKDFIPLEYYKKLINTDNESQYEVFLYEIRKEIKEKYQEAGFQ